jgi:hypothetical protein
MSQAGQIRLSQLAAYDADGNVKKVKFHVSIYDNSGVGAYDMPRLPLPRDDPDFPPYLAARNEDCTVIPTTYTSESTDRSQTHPFFRGGWEQFQPDGTHFPWGLDVQLPTVPPKVGWGNYYEPAGYSPGRFSKGAARTGVLTDDSAWSWDLTPDLNLDKPKQNDPENYAGMLFIMIYCDDQNTEPVFFMGRFIRVEPGQS